ncbi:YjbE family putative metal transport protein [Polynucleobacter sp. AP-Capit-er-40B-B4]|nr:YjbE family putative metal transport protein [Polynucleobacter sp. AP-Capit-er-40B-B4]
MELFSPEFFSALLAIVVIDLVLAGDNAIVIAMAARNLPAHLQKKAIVWGAVGAIAVRSAMTLVVVYLLKIPGLMLIGGLLLVWIAYKLLTPAKDDDDGHSNASTSFWGAMKTIVIADAVMGLDNVLAVAGASHGSYVLVVLGLLISIPIVIWGSTQILKLVERYPSITYIGAGVLAWTAAKMMMSEPMVKEMQLFQNPAFGYAVQALVIFGVLFGGFMKSRLALEETIAPAVVDTEVSDKQSYNVGEKVMNKVLIPVDDSSNALMALKHAVNMYGNDRQTHFHICNVQPTLYTHIRKFLSKQTINEWQADRAKTAAKTASEFLEKAGANFSFTYVTGDKGEALRDEAQRLECNRIVIGTSKKNTLSRLFENSTTAKLLEISDIPVEVVTGKSLSTLERWGIPALGAGAATALMAAVID